MQNEGEQNCLSDSSTICGFHNFRLIWVEGEKESSQLQAHFNLNY